MSDLVGCWLVDFDLIEGFLNDGVRCVEVGKDVIRVINFVVGLGDF